MALIEPIETVRQSTQKDDVAKRFSKAAKQYDQLANIQSVIAATALDRICVKQAKQALDIGCGTGRHTKTLSTHSSVTTGLDIAEGMLSQAAHNYPTLNFVHGDAEQLPWQPNTFELVFSSMVLQWCRSPLQAISEICRVLTPGGQGELAIMVEGSFAELFNARKHSNVALRINPLFSAQDWLTAAKHVGLNCRKPQILSYQDAFEGLLPLLRSINGIGAGSTTYHAGGQALNRYKLKQLESHMPRNADGYLVNTYQVLHLSLEKQV